MKINELRKLTNEDLNKKITESKKELLDLRIKQSTGSLEKPSKIHELRKDVARMKTILRERELSEGGENYWQKLKELNLQVRLYLLSAIKLLLF